MVKARPQIEFNRTIGGDISVAISLRKVCAVCTFSGDKGYFQVHLGPQRYYVYNTLYRLHVCVLAQFCGHLRFEL